MTLRRSRLLPIWLLLAAALMLRLAVPVGWMPELGEQGFRIAVCSGNQSEFVTLGRDGKLHKQAPKPAAAGDMCPYALASAMAANAAPVAHLAPPPLSAPLIFAPAPASSSPVPQAHDRPPATGPPLLA